MSAKIFTVKRSEIEGRLDPIYYIRKNELVGYKHLKLEKIGKHFFVKDGDHDKLPDDAVSDENNGFRYLRAQDLKENKIISEKPIYVTKKYFESVRRCHIYPNDLLFSIMASVGATAVVPKNFSICTANRAVGILRAKDEVVFLPEYVQVVLNTELGIKLLELQKRGGIQQRVNLDDISNLELPVFDFEKQRKIIDFYNSALSQKEQKQEQAKKLLASIDSYLLSELGITLPQKDNSLSKRIFTTKFSEVTGGRLDPVFNNEYFKEVEKSFQSKYKLYQLKLLANTIFQGCGQDLTEEKSKKLLKVKNIQTGNIIDYDDIENIREIPKSKILMSGDIISPFIGEAIRQIKFSVFYTPIKNYEWTVDNNTGVIRINEKIADSYFIAEVLNSSIGELQIEKLISGGGVPFIGANNAKKLLIPLPPLPKQKEIAGYIRSIRAQAKQLQAEAEQIMQDAKHQVEKMILGE